MGTSAILPHADHEDSSERDSPLRDQFNTIRDTERTGCQWQYLPNDFRRCAVYQQARRFKPVSLRFRS